MQESILSSEKIVIAEDLEKNDEKQVDFFSSPRNHHLLTQIQAFSRCEHSIALLIGPTSSGKTTLLEYFAKQNSRTRHLVTAHTKINWFQYLSQQLLDYEVPDDAEKTVESLLKIINNITSEFILIVDDADLLTINSLEEILFAFQQQPPNFKIIFSDKMYFQNRIAAIVKKYHLATDYKVLNIPAFSLKETTSYVKQYLQANHRAINKKMIEEIHQLSGGYPGRINRLVQPLLTKQTQVKSKPSVWDKLLILGIICLLSLLIWRVVNILTSDKTVNKSLEAQSKSPPMIHKPINKKSNSFSFIASIENLPEETVLVNEDTIILPEPLLLSK